MTGRAAAPSLGGLALEMLLLGAALYAGAALAVAPMQVVYTFGFAPGSADLAGEAASCVALAVSTAQHLGRPGGQAARPAPVWFQVAGFAPGDAVLAAKRASAVRDALHRAGVAPERVVSLEPGRAPRAPEPVSNPFPSGPDRAEVALCPTADRWCLPR